MGYQMNSTLTFAYNAPNQFQAIASSVIISLAITHD